MNYKTYLEACKNFSRDSEPWLRKDDCSFYVTRGDDSDWTESADNACGGISVEWAFHLSENEIDERGPEEYAQVILEEFAVLRENECDEEGWEKSLKFFEFRRDY